MVSHTRSMTRSQQSSPQDRADDSQVPAPVTPTPSPGRRRPSARSQELRSPSHRVSKTSSGRKSSKSSSKRGSLESAVRKTSRLRINAEEPPEHGDSDEELPDAEPLSKDAETQTVPPAMVSTRTQTGEEVYHNATLPPPSHGQLSGFKTVGEDQFKGRISVQNFKNKRGTFARGTIVRIPSHRPNMNPYLIKETKFLKRTPIGGVYSKMRMGIVLWKFARRMMILPLCSFQGKGIVQQPEENHGELVEICNESDRRKYLKRGVNEVLGAEMNTAWGINVLSCVDISAAISVDYVEDIQIVGMMTPQSKRALNSLVHALIDKDEAEERRLGY